MNDPCKLQLYRGPDVLKDIPRLAVRIEDKLVFELDLNDTKSVFFEAGGVLISIEMGNRTLLRQRVELPGETRLKLSIAPAGLIERIIKRTPFVLREIERADQPRYDPGPIRAIRSQMWLGTVADEGAFHDFMTERAEYYSVENEDAEGTDRHVALSAFAESQDEDTYDHDFLEYGFAASGKTLEERFTGHSWVAQWAPILREMLPAQEISAANAYVQLRVEESAQFGVRRYIETPHDINLAGIRLRFIGEIVRPDR